jgi:hypothetical protein
MLKKTFNPWVTLSLIMIVVACSTKQENNGHTTQEASQGDWAEMDEFHMVMAEAFHPYKDSANLEPARQNASSLVSAAEKWSQAQLPEKFEGDDEIKFKLNQLKADASTFASIAETGDDKSVGESLTKLHNLFHSIQESWYEPHEEHH